jgi:hypothetical protein
MSRLDFAAGVCERALELRAGIVVGPSSEDCESRLGSIDDQPSCHRKLVAENFALSKVRWLRLLALPGLWFGLPIVLASLRGVCISVGSSCSITQIGVLGSHDDPRLWSFGRPSPLLDACVLSGPIQLPFPLPFLNPSRGQFPSGDLRSSPNPPTFPKGRPLHPRPQKPYVFFRPTENTYHHPFHPGPSSTPGFESITPTSELPCLPSATIPVPLTPLVPPLHLPRWRFTPPRCSRTSNPPTSVRTL